MSIDDAVEFIASHSTASATAIRHNRAVRNAAYRAAAQKLHPDKGGSHEQFCKLQEAMEVLS